MKDRILEIVGKEGPLKAKEIASKIGVTKSEVNALLYGTLASHVVQNNEYQWTLRLNGKVVVPEEHSSARTDTLLGKFCSYYLESISKDMDTGISVFASSKYGKPDYIQLDKIVDEESGSNMDHDSIGYLTGKLRKNRNSLGVAIGYPLQLIELKSKAGYSYYRVLPILLQSIDASAFEKGVIKLSDENPYINPDAVAFNESVKGTDVLQQIIQLNADLGLDSTNLHQIGDVGLRLKGLRPSWSWADDTNPDHLNPIDLSKNTSPGIYNSCAIFLSERSKYTVGLEKDLSELAKLDDTAYQHSILGKILSHKLQGEVVEDSVILEPLPTNEEQRHAVLNGLKNDLTVVTGPPGTGKSQVVSTLIVNAVHQGQRILFASRNNKAVDVVLERVNGLTNKPVMLRLGNNAMQDELSRYLTGVLSNRVSEDDRSRFQKVNEEHSNLIQKVKELDDQQHKIILLRNEVDAKEQQVESIRNKIGDELFRYFYHLSAEQLSNAKHDLNKFDKAINSAKFLKLSIGAKLGWLFTKGKRLQNLNERLNNLTPTYKLLRLEGKSNNNIKLALTIAKEQSKIINERIQVIYEIQSYRYKLDELKHEKSVEELITNENNLIDQISENSLELWSLWLNLQSDRLTSKDRKVIGDYITMLDLIVKSEQEGQLIHRSIWAKYYRILPKVSSILSCWAVTSLSVRSKVPFESGFFDLVIIDEASQCDIASAIPLLFRAKRAVIIGDDKQLTHISSISNYQDNQLLEKHGLLEDHLIWSYSSTSLFRLSASMCRPEDVIQLKDHHRSHADIISYSNKYFYDGSLRVATKYDRLKSIPGEPTIRWIDVKGSVIRPSGGGSLNEIEAKRIVLELERLVETSYKGSIGVVAPFRAQANRIRDLVFSNQELGERLLTREFIVDTVHKFQGDERDLMIFSSVLAEGMGKGSEGFLATTGNLFNVAITRARAVLIVIGDRVACSNSRVKHFAQFAEHVKNTTENHSKKEDHTEIDLGPKFPSDYESNKVSDWEKILYEELYRNGIKTVPQFGVERYSLDLALFINGRRLDIEVDGEAYHRSWDGELMRRDKLRNKRLIELGWDVHRFWVYQIRDDMNSCVEHIKDWIKKVEK